MIFGDRLVSGTGLSFGLPERASLAFMFCTGIREETVFFTVV
jgi:hypothetical protein